MDRKRSIWVALLLVFALVAAACGGDDDSTGGTAAPATTTAAPAATTAAPAVEPVSSEPILIGNLTSFTGPFTPWGIQVRDGMQMAVEEINAAGGVGGRMLELVVVDDQSNAEEATNGIERLIEDGVVAVAGTISSDVGLSTSRIAEDAQVPLFMTKAGSSAILTTDSRYTFRACLPAAPMVAAPIAQYAQAQGLSRVGAVIADYGWGQSIRASLEAEFDALPGVDLQIEVAPVPEKDFTTYLRSLDGFDPEFLVATGHPPGTGALTIQSGDLGMGVPITGPWASLAAVMEGLGDSGIGRYSDFSCADYFSDSYQDLAQRYLAFSGNPFMEDDAVAGFGIVTMLADAISNVGDDPAAIAEYLHGQTYDLPGYAHELGWTEWGEIANSQPIMIVVGDGSAPEGLETPGGWYPELLIQAAPIPPHVPGEAPAVEPVSSEPILIGNLTSFTGPFTPWGIQVRDGMQMAVEEINAAGGVGGRMLELVVVDDQSNAEEATNGIERLIEDGVVAVAGTISSDVGLSTSRIAEDAQVPLFMTKAGSSAILTTDSRYTFRACLPAAPMVAAPIAQYAQAQGLSRVGAVIADYGWGQSIRASLEAEFDALPGVDLQIEVAPVPEKDFTTYLRSLDGFDPEFLVATGHPPGTGALTIQSGDLGMGVPITGPWASLAAVMEGLGDSGIGRYSDFSCADYFSDSYQDLAQRYLAFSGNPFMEDDAVAGFGIVTMLADAISNVGDDPAAIAEYLHGQTYDLPGYAHELGWTEWGEIANSQPIMIVVGDGSAPEGLETPGGWYPELLIQAAPIPPHVPS